MLEAESDSCSVELVEVAVMRLCCDAVAPKDVAACVALELEDIVLRAATTEKSSAS